LNPRAKAAAYRLGFGTWPLKGTEAERAVAAAIHAGYRLIDTAARYENEKAVARGISSTGFVRSEIHVTTKLRGRDHVAGNVRAAVEQSLENLGIDTIDLYLIHWPLPRFGRFVAVYEELLEIQEEGLIDQVGVSNFKPSHIEQLMAATGRPPAVNQIQLNPRHARLAARTFHASLGRVAKAGF
jgi:2,5-diketo-D-gluconate reductase A